jgi:hypothetical protein
MLWISLVTTVCMLKGLLPFLEEAMTKVQNLGSTNGAVMRSFSCIWAKALECCLIPKRSPLPGSQASGATRGPCFLAESRCLVSLDLPIKKINRKQNLGGDPMGKALTENGLCFLMRFSCFWRLTRGGNDTLELNYCQFVSTPHSNSKRPFLFLPNYFL